MTNERGRKAGRPTLSAEDRVLAALQRYNVMPGSALLAMSQLSAEVMYEALDRLVEAGTVVESKQSGRAAVYYLAEVAERSIAELFPAMEKELEEAA